MTEKTRLMNETVIVIYFFPSERGISGCSLLTGRLVANYADRLTIQLIFWVLDELLFMLGLPIDVEVN